MTTLTKDQLQDLREEFVEFKINEMTSEDMASYIRDIMIHDVNVLNKEELEFEINSYDENLYEILEDYVTDTVGSYTALQEFIHDRHANDWIEN
jgi:hypothetical protein